jgi:hypothetical protein
MKCAVEMGSAAMFYNDWSRHSKVSRVGLADSQTAW